ncbi:MAG TPA: molybdopterin-dependent oxidoreductase [Clostridia bacterium]|nr:molybdopterin-dependent oxidoreductase [Clostridia bacterium]
MKKRGKGIACMFYPIASTAKASPGGVFLKVNHDGTATVIVGAVDWGQGSTTIFQQIVAEGLGIEPGAVRVIPGNTDIAPFDHGAGASRTTYVLGKAVEKAVAQAKQLLQEAAADMLGLAGSHTLVFEDGVIKLKGFPKKSVSLAQAAFHSERVNGVPVIAAASSTPVVTGLDEETGQGMPFETWVFATQIAEVEVDTCTGEVEVLKITAVHDCGKMLNPVFVEGQVQGGIVMGQGYALMEELMLDPETAQVLNDSFVDYHIPTAVDVPREMVIEVIEEKDANGPYGAKGIGEPTQLPTAPAIINAIYDAVGVKIYDLPATPEKILKALGKLPGD